MQSIAEIQTKLSTIVNVPMSCPKTANKGAVGHLLEEKVGIPRSSACLDCTDGEVKVVPFKKLKNGSLVPKETTSITMLSEDDLRKHEFSDSRCYHKIRNMLMIPYIRDGDNITFLPETLIQPEGEVLEVLKADYDAIRQQFIDTGILQSKTGKYLQNRTKGPGGPKKTRAFFLRTNFTKTFCKTN